MKLFRLLVCSALVAAPTLAAAAPTTFVNGRFYTPHGWARAMAVDGGKIVAVGTEAAVKAKAGKGATVVDLGGRTVLPGLADMHVHPTMAGQYARNCTVAQGATPEQFLAKIAACVKAKKPGEWIQGGQWEAISMGTTPITKETLDRISPDNPVTLTDIAGHSAWVNSRALALAGITRDTPNPQGGIIERDARGEPTGILRENARAPLDAKIPRETPAETAAALKYALDTLLSQGVVTITDALMLRPIMVAYDTLADTGQLKQHVLGCITYRMAPDFEQLVATRASFARPNFRPQCVKVFMDGVPTDSHTGAMVEPYADAAAQKNAPPRGLLIIPPAELNPAVTRWDKMGLVVKFHAAGDQATRSALDAIEAARKANGMSGPRHMVAHNTFITLEDIGRAKPLRATWEFSPYLWYPSPITEDITKAVGPERMTRVWPLKEGIASGALSISGSDWPVVADGNPWVGLETAVTRRKPGGGGEQFGGAEAITLPQAIEMFTINAARETGDEARRGSLEAGKEADFIVTDKDPFAIPATQIHTVEVQQTWIGGQKVYQR